MSIFTKWFDLFKYRADEDGMQTFNIDVALNENWDKVDTALHGLDAGKEALVKNAATKTSPVDADSVVLVDSADGSKTKRLTWGNIKTALEHTHPIKGIIGLVEKLAEIEQAMSNKVNQSDKNLLYRRTDLGERSILEAVKSCIQEGYKTGVIGVWEAAPVPDGPPNFLYGAAKYLKHSTGVATVTALSDNAPMSTRRLHTNDWIWLDDKWSEIATAEPPQEYDLPVRSGLSAYGGYWRNQFCEVTIDVQINSGTGFVTGQVVATLPAGYRPKIEIGRTVSISPQRAPAIITIQTGGDIVLDFDTGGLPKNLYINVRFLAA